MARTTQQKFKAVLVDLGRYVHTIIASCYEQGIKVVDPQIVSLVIDVLSTYDEEILLTEFVKGSIAQWSFIRTRDEIFFTEHIEDIFYYMKPERREKLHLFKQLVLLRTKNGEPALSAGVKNHIWDLLEYLVKFSVRYMKETGFYNSFVDVDELCKFWKIK